ncbi:spore cortex biosynthesis protein YabQ [Aneurinibacillus sp. Ricciae_BoGa-3]|uniref:spore cortex biosynthesis protein YabQ n=1 Tax=Aneurinibacillus sp. Ricciae_BoGa-3 TaxID=3022697 RepID=UPI00234247B0|nr:spore cortex biosynthesis protein YabQ [Aneurinibacillus sp. Ricciae_BoGa-3]WCK54638.1 spore cortex biosynthesis protein YabQ [Aneurinibacillus sp. Ricciae_BoGa-3]
MTITSQALTLLSMAFCGMGIGMLFDTYRTLERKSGLSGWVIWLCDFLFWVSCIFLVFGTLLRVNEGIVRIYVFLGIAIGAISYLLFLQPAYLYLLGKMIALIVWLYGRLLMMLKYLVLVPLVSLYRLVVSILLFTAKLLLKIAGWLFRPFRWLGLMLWKRLGQPGKKQWLQVTRLWARAKNALTNWVKRKRM